MVEKKNVIKEDTWQLGYNHSTYAKAGNFIYTSYHTGIYHKESELLETIEAQTEECFENLEDTLKAAGASLNDIIKTTVYLKHIGNFEEKQAEFQKMDKVYERFFKAPFPVRTTIWTSFFLEECLIQIDVVAFISN